MPWSGDVDRFVEECALAPDASRLRDELGSVPDDRWNDVRDRLRARLDEVVPGEPESPPLTRGEGRGPEVLSQTQLQRHAQDLEAKRRAVDEEDRRRR